MPGCSCSCLLCLSFSPYGVFPKPAVILPCLFSGATSLVQHSVAAPEEQGRMQGTQRLFAHQPKHKSLQPISGEPGSPPRAAGLAASWPWYQLPAAHPKGHHIMAFHVLLIKKKAGISQKNGHWFSVMAAKMAHSNAAHAKNHDTIQNPFFHYTQHTSLSSDQQRDWTLWAAGHQPPVNAL